MMLAGSTHQWGGARSCVSVALVVLLVACSCGSSSAVTAASVAFDGTSRAPFRFGILGAAAIAHKHYSGMSAAPGVELYAVASRSLAKATKFAEGKSIAHVYGSYDQLLDDPLVDAVYVPLPTGVRKEWVIKAASKGKHVLCEKPTAVNASDLEDMLRACEHNNVLFMDGVMFVHHPRQAAMREQLAAIGRLRSVMSTLSFAAPPEFFTGDIRVSPDLEPFGALGDVGWYNVRLSLWAFGWEMPEAVSAQFHAQHNGVPTDVTVSLRFSGGRFSTFTNSFSVATRQFADIAGDVGSLFVRDFVLPATVAAEFDVVSPEFTENWLVEERVTHHTVPAGPQQHVHMVENFARLARALSSGASRAGSSGGESDHATQALMTQVVLDAAFESGLSGKTVDIVRPASLRHDRDSG